MKDATYFAEIACRQMTPEEVCKFRPLIYNLFLQCQADTVDACAGLVLHVGCLPDGSQTFPESIAAYLIAHALQVHPGHETDPNLLKALPISAPSNEEAKSDTPPFIGGSQVDTAQLPPAA